MSAARRDDAQQVMHMQPRDTGDRRNSARSCEPVRRNVQHRMARQRRHRQGGASQGSFEQQEIRAPPAAHQIVDMAADAASQFVATAAGWGGPIAGTAPR